MTTGSWKGRGSQYIQFIRVLYSVNCQPIASNYQLSHLRGSLCMIPILLEAMQGTEPQPQRWEARVLPFCHHGPTIVLGSHILIHEWYCDKKEILTIQKGNYLFYIYNEKSQFIKKRAPIKQIKKQNFKIK